MRYFAVPLLDQKGRMKTIAAIAAALVPFAASALAAGPCDGRYEGVLTVQGEKGSSAAPLTWTVRDTKIYGGFEGPSGLFLIEGTVDGRCAIVSGAATDYVAGEPMPVVGTVTEGMFKHNGQVRVTYRMQKE